MQLLSTDPGVFTLFVVLLDVVLVTLLVLALARTKRPPLWMHVEVDEGGQLCVRDLEGRRLKGVRAIDVHHDYRSADELRITCLAYDQRGYIFPGRRPH